MLSAFMGFVEQGDEVIVFEPFFDQCEFHPFLILLLLTASGI
jgi:aspartate/methionine/tyrosine aminotransferase